jgi:hypothetical protein
MAVLLVFSASAVCDPVEVDVDIKPGSDENPVNVKSNGVLPVAVLGNDTLNVTDINQTTIRLNGTCVPLRCSYEDVNDDGYDDLVIKFDAQDVVGCLPESCEDGDIVTLTLTAELYDETEIAGSDDVRVLKKGKGN